MFGSQEMIAIATLIIANATALVTVFTNLNVKIAEIAKDNLSIKADLEEHKIKNKDDIVELKDVTLRDRVDNKNDHQRIFDQITCVISIMSDLKVDLVREIKKSNK